VSIKPAQHTGGQTGEKGEKEEPHVLLMIALYDNIFLAQRRGGKGGKKGIKKKT